MKNNLIILFLLLCNIHAFGERAVPQRAVSTAQFTTEILLAIGAEKQMVGTAYLDDEILPELKESYERVPVLSKTAPSKEYFYQQNPDFLTGWNSIVTSKGLGSKEELEGNGVQVYLMKSQNSNKIEDVYSDILALGKIFDLEKNSNEIVENMKAEFQEVKSLLPKEQVKVFAYDSGENAPFIVGGTGIGNTLIEMAGGRNIFKDTKGSFVNGNWEEILFQDPDYIIIVNYGNTSYEDKVNFLKTKSPLKDLKAVSENRFIKVNLSELSPGIRNLNTVRYLFEKLNGV
ncbi:MAG: ABC transporter substrate-binding protein [Fusobacteriaceae bacterium]